MPTSAKGYFDTEYLRVVAEIAEEYKRRTYSLMKIEKGHKVLDAGCGPGTDTIALGSLVGPSGEVYGVDFDPAMIAEANRRAATAGVAHWVHHQDADATAMPFESGYFDSCRSERLFQHLLNPRGALAEMTRVTKKGGWIVVLDTDWGSCGIDTDEVELERRLMTFYATETYHNGYSGRRLSRFFKEHDLADISVEVIPYVCTNYQLARYLFAFDSHEAQALAEKIVTEEELRRWHESLQRDEENGTFFSCTNIAMAAGRKP